MVIQFFIKNGMGSVVEVASVEYYDGGGVRYAEGHPLLELIKSKTPVQCASHEQLPVKIQTVEDLLKTYCFDNL